MSILQSCQQQKAAAFVIHSSINKNDKKKRVFLRHFSLLWYLTLWISYYIWYFYLIWLFISIIATHYVIRMLHQSMNVNWESIVIFVVFKFLYEKYIFVSFWIAFLSGIFFYNRTGSLYITRLATWKRTPNRDSVRENFVLRGKSSYFWFKILIMFSRFILYFILFDKYMLQWLSVLQFEFK